MRVFFLGNNWLGWQVVQYLREQKEQIVGLVLHPRGRRRFGDEIQQAAGVDSSVTFVADRLAEPDVLDAIRSLKPDIGVSVLFGYILRDDLLQLFRCGVLNLHPGYLPYNRGAYPNVWSIVEGTPAGVTLHYVDSGVDTGDIVAQSRVSVEPVDTGKSLYDKLGRASVELFEGVWPMIRSGRSLRTPQARREGTEHRVRDVERIDCVDLGKLYTGRELIDVIRARTFEPYPGAYFVHDGRKVYMRIDLFYEDATGGDDGAT